MADAAIYFILRSIIPKIDPFMEELDPHLIHGSWKLDQPDSPDPTVHPNSSSIASAVLQKYSGCYQLTAERLNSLLNSSKFLVTSNYVSLINVGIPAILPISIYKLSYCMININKSFLVLKLWI